MIVIGNRRSCVIKCLWVEGVCVNICTGLLCVRKGESAGIQLKVTIVRNVNIKLRAAFNGKKLSIMCTNDDHGPLLSTEITLLEKNKLNNRSWVSSTYVTSNLKRIQYFFRDLVSVHNILQLILWRWGNIWNEQRNLCGTNQHLLSRMSL